MGCFFFFRWEVRDWQEEDVDAIQGGQHTDNVLM